MKFIVDVDALVNCIDLACGAVKINGDVYLPLPVVKEFIMRFPKDKINNTEDCDYAGE